MLTLRPDGRIGVEADGLTDEALEALSAGLAGTTLADLLKSVLDQDRVEVEDDPASGLATLAETLRCALREVDNRVLRLREGT